MFEELAPIDLSYLLMEATLEDEEERKTNPSRWNKWKKSKVPEAVREFDWLRRRNVSPTRQRLARLHVALNDRCVNCGRS